MKDNLPQNVLRPRHGPARMLYDVFQTEATKRKGRTVEQWQDAEERAAWTAARDYAQAYGLYVPTLLEIQQASFCASGSIDYGAKWAYAVEKLMVPLELTRTER